MTRDTANLARIGLFTLLLALGFAPVSAEDAKTPPPDIVYVVKDQKRIAFKGEILEETPTELKIKTADGEKKFKWDEVGGVERGQEPIGLRQAVNLENRNDFEGAARTYKEVAADCDGGKARALFKQQALLSAGRALVNAGKFGDAADAFQAAAKASGRALREAVREGVRALIRAKKADAALEAANAAKTSYAGASLPDDAKDEAMLLEAEALEACGRTDDARAKYNVVTNSRDPKVKGRAALGAARAAYLGHDVDRAEGSFKEILDQQDVERSIQCGAARGLGDSIMSRPGADKDFLRLRAAATAYAQALAVYFPARGEPTEDREAALHQGARVYDALATASGKDAKGRELYLGMARQLREELVKLYRNSQYRAEDEQKLEKAGEGSAETPK